MLRRLGLLTLLVATTAQARPIIGGTAAKKGDFPAVVVLDVGQGALCTGELIDPEWILTAAHCVDPAVVGTASQAALTASVRVHFGTVNESLDTGTVVTAKDTFFNTKFDVNNLGQFDVGLIHMSTAVTNVTPFRVNFVPARSPVGTVVTFAGFGTRAAGGTGPAGALFVITNRTSISCGQNQIGNDADLMCFPSNDGKGICEGDSGGPDLAMIDGVATVVGINSFSDTNCTAFSGSTRPDAEKAFILSHVPQIECNTDTECDAAAAKTCFNHSCMVAPFAPTGIGTVCTGNGSCDSNECAAGPGSDKLCVSSCTVADATTCPGGFDCLDTGGGGGACWPSTSGGGGCCDAGDHGMSTMLVGIGLVALGLRRRRPA